MVAHTRKAIVSQHKSQRKAAKQQTPQVKKQVFLHAGNGIHNANMNNLLMNIHKKVLAPGVGGEHFCDIRL